MKFSVLRTASPARTSCDSLRPRMERVPMTSTTRRLSTLAALLLAAISMDAAAASKRELAATQALDQRMQAAEAKYRDAAVLIANADPQGQKQSDEALEDMEDVVAACMKQRGCSVPTMLAAYKRLLKLNADAEADAAGDEPEGDTDHGHDMPLA